ncbi:hypothetical protein GCM10022198_21490 [Klugiella xanthotipulae]|uniref:ATP synthase protein I n=1 Tax=Klugiella xanthotipulae TaxID=244735 RepID=A0A543HY10_9MICO|nr:hypothetical protein [Klugiella xanthotipulae]TQM63236.1 hypothetical protein FB466_1492 [Klugiella xanthotipulae]
MTDPISHDPATTPEVASEERRVPSSQPILLRAVTVGGIAAVVVTVVMSVIGWCVDGGTGLASGALGSVSAFVFLGVTAASILVSNFFVQSDFYVVIFFGLVLGSWILKFVLFIVAALLLKDQPWINPTMFFISVIVGVLASLLVDVFVVAKSRVPYVGDLSKDRAV